MEFYEKLQQLRKQKNLTQEELAQKLYVSRTAISKWESGRGYPSIDSLKTISGFFSVSIDDLLSGEELVSLAESDQKEKATSIYGFIFGILDCMTALLFLLPIFGQEKNGIVQMIPLLAYAGRRDYILAVYVIALAVIIIFGVVQLALQNWDNRTWLKGKGIISFCLTIFVILFTIFNRQPYPSVFLLCLLLLKGILLLKQR